MRLLWINPASREVTAIEGDPEALHEKILPPQGMVDIDPTLGIVVCTIGAIGNDVALWWHHELAEVFGGEAFIAGLDEHDNMTGVSEGSWLRARRSIEFLGSGEPALKRLRELVWRTMQGDAPDPRQGTLELEPDNDLQG